MQENMTLPSTVMGGQSAQDWNTQAVVRWLSGCPRKPLRNDR
jgi:hypothetical protein